jgi:hypothetical protein
MKQFILIIILLALSYSKVLSQGCLPQGISFITQAQVDNFQTNYPGCTEIEGSVIIQGQNITNLNGLNPDSAIEIFSTFMLRNPNA